MNVTEYRQRRSVARNDLRRALHQINVEYAESNNIVKIGDIISDGYHTIMVQAIDLQEHMEDYTLSTSKWRGCIYEGRRMSKSGKLYVKGEVHHIWQTSLLSINGVSIKDFRPQCPRCGSRDIHPSFHGRNPEHDVELCDVCYWRKRAEAKEEE